MISVTKLRSGATFEMDGKPYRVTDYKHTHLSRGSGTIRVKARELESGRLVNLTFKSGDQVQDISVERYQMQFLYGDGQELHFMNPNTYEQLTMESKVVGDGAKFLREGENVFVLFWDEKPLDIDLAPKVEMEVIECAPGEKGNSASNVYKDSVVEGGLKVRVPLFINVGDRIRVDTRSGEYVERAS